MRVIELSKGHVAIVDDEDFLELAQYKWCIGGHGYAYRAMKNCESHPRKVIYMHRAILGDIPGMVIDHINGNKLDNRRCNLRHATRGQNNANAGLRKNNTTGFKGVSIRRDTGKFMAQITVNGVNRKLGTFATAEEAHAAYAAEAKNNYGEFAKLN